MLDIYVDADACPVKQEIYRVAQRYGLHVTVVSNTWLHVPEADWLEQVTVGGGPDAADDWIAEHAGEGDIVITADIPLAARCLDKGALVLDFRGGGFNKQSVQDALAVREILSLQRDMGLITGGPAPFEKHHRSMFLQSFDETLQSLRRWKR